MTILEVPYRHTSWTERRDRISTADVPQVADATIEAELRVPVATIQNIRFRLLRPVDNVLRDEGAYRLDLCTTPRTPNARMSFSNHWEPHRFEKLGKVFLVPPGQAPRFKSDVGAQASVICNLMAEPLRNWFDSELRWTDRRLEASINITSPNVRNIMIRLGEEARHPGFASDVLCEALAVQMAVELGRYFSDVTELPRTGGLTPWRLRLIDERLRDVREAPTLAELAEICNISVRQLTRGFRVSCGRSIGSHIAEARMENAKRLLTTDESVKSIAYSMGFASPSSFCYAFRKATGASPRQFRERPGGNA